MSPRQVRQDNPLPPEKLAAAGFTKALWQRLWPRPEAGASSFRQFFWALFRIVAVFCREFKRNNIPLRSSALTFTIVLSLVPTLALGTAVLKGLGAGNQMREAAYRFVDQIEGTSPQSIARQEAAAASTADSGITPSPEANKASKAPISTNTEMQGHLHLAVAKIFDYVERTDFAALGAFGIIGLVIAVLSVLTRIEQAMNVIWRATAGRPMGRKLMDYLALMILLPISVNLGFAAEAMLRNTAMLKIVHGLLPIALLSRFFFSMLPMLIIITTFSVLYRFLPNIKVRLLPALAGGIVGGISWFLIQTIYVKLQIGVAKYNAIYGSFATLPLFLLWLNIAWLVFLSGAEVSFACQVFKDYEWQPPKLSSYNRLALAFDLLDDIFIDFKERHLTTLADLRARHSQYNHRSITAVLTLLVKGGLLRQVEGTNDSYVPGAPIASFTPADVIKLVWGGEPAGYHALVDQALNHASTGLAWPRLDSAYALNDGGYAPPDTECC